MLPKLRKQDANDESQGKKRSHQVEHRTVANVLKAVSSNCSVLKSPCKINRTSHFLALTQKDECRNEKK